MQFGIRTLLIVTTAVAALCGIVFAAPPIVAIPVLCTMLWVCPSVWITGIIYARGARRAFFIGGMAAGFAPHSCALYYSVMIVVSTFDGNSLADLFTNDEPWANLLNAAILLGPGVFAFLGGACGAIVYWWNQPPRTSPSAPPPAGEYLVVSGRLTTTPVLPAADPDEREYELTRSGRTESPRTA
jgi:hypothetical protein